MITVDLLTNHQSEIPRLAKIWHEVLGKIWMPDLSIEYIEQLVGSWVNDKHLPIAHVALSNGKVVGVASLQKNCSIRQNLTPWLGSLIVDPLYQKQGIGKILINATKQKAIEFGFNKLYLFAFDPNILDYYRSLGWTTIGMDEFKGHPVTVMEAMLQSHS